MRLASLLRVLGPLVEVVCLILLFAVPRGRRTIAGVPLDPVIYGGLAVGFAMVVVGVGLAMMQPMPRANGSRASARSLRNLGDGDGPAAGEAEGERPS